jgi:hypothetical protein
LAAIAAACVAVAPFVLLPASAAAASEDDVPKAVATVLAVEYYHAELDHYFISVDPDEINGLDTHYFAGWDRTGRQFYVYPLGTAGLASTCRFFSTAFGPKTSHFYTAYLAECDYVKLNPNWQFEGERFSVALPDGAGNCPAGTVQLYRVFNNGHGGAPNHRFVTSPADRQAMLALGYADEGVQMCVGAPPVVAGTAEGKWRGTTPEHHSVDMWVLGDGTFYAVYTQPYGAVDSGVVLGTSTSVGGIFDSVDAKDTAFRKDPSFMTSFSPVVQVVHGTFVPRQSMQLSFGGRAVTLVYDAAYDQPASLSAVQGNYVGNSGHFADPHEGAIATVDGLGNFSMTSSECQAAGGLIPRGTVNVFDASVIGTANQCALGLRTLSPGYGFYDAATRLLRVLVKFPDSVDLWFFVGGH